MCEKEKGYKEFHKLKNGKYFSYCKKCRSELNKRYHFHYQIKNRDALNSKKEIYLKTESGIKVAKEKALKWRANNKDKISVHNLVNRSNIEKRPCLICKKEEKIDGHHEDYSKPLEITWLCHRCHMLWHQILNEWKRQEADGRFDAQILSYQEGLE